MIIRVVRMQFSEAGESGFLKIFRDHENTIRNFPGCLFLELLKDQETPHTYATFSHWKNMEALENYRKSQPFIQIWGKVKPLFSNRPMAFSFETLKAGKG